MGVDMGEWDLKWVGQKVGVGGAEMGVDMSGWGS